MLAILYVPGPPTLGITRANGNVPAVHVFTFFSFRRSTLSFVWALVTLILNRSLLNMQKASLRCRAPPLALTSIKFHSGNGSYRRIKKHGCDHGESISKIFSDPSSDPKLNTQPSYVVRSDSTNAGANPVPGRPGVRILRVGTQREVPQGNTDQPQPSASPRSSYASSHFRQASLADPVLEEQEELVYPRVVESGSDRRWPSWR